MKNGSFGSRFSLSGFAPGAWRRPVRRRIECRDVDIGSWRRGRRGFQLQAGQCWRPACGYGSRPRPDCLCACAMFCVKFGLFCPIAESPKKASAWVVIRGGRLYNQADFLPALGIITHVNNSIGVGMAIKYPDAARILKKAYKSVVRQTYDQIETWA